jgi:hypothetical protein
MILIKQIVGESLNLDTGEEISKGLLLSNGISEIVVPANDELLRAVILLVHEARGGPSVENSRPVREAPAPTAARAPTPRKPSAAPAAAAASFVIAPVPNEMEEHLSSDSVSDFMSGLDGDFEEEEGFDPGEVYEDPDTGTASI